MRAAVDNHKCQAHGVCALTAPTVFEVGESDGYSYVLVDEIPDADLTAAQSAASGCPEGAISILN
jgi:ferredoxin